MMMMMIMKWFSESSYDFDIWIVSVRPPRVSATTGTISTPADLQAAR